MLKYDKISGANPEMGIREIAEKLKITGDYLRRLLRARAALEGEKMNIKGSNLWTEIWGSNLGTEIWGSNLGTKICDRNLGAKFGHQILVTTNKKMKKKNLQLIIKK